jgi:type IV pilus assembly protein PilQ
MYMTTKATHLRGRSPACIALALMLLVFAGSALAASTTLSKISHRQLPGGQVELDLTFAGGPAPQPAIFTTSEPPRIAVDFDHTANGIAKKHMDIGIGATSGISVVAAGGRTRMVVDLLRPASYRVQRQGDTLKLVIANGEATTTGTRAATIDPTKVLPSQPGSAVISRIDFRRGAHGAARVLIDFSGSGLQSRIQAEDGKVIVHLDDVRVPEKLAKRLDVMDFATPVTTIDTKAGQTGGGTITLAVTGPVATSSYKADHQLVIEVAKKAGKKDQDELGAAKKKSYSGSRVTFNFQDIPVRAALQLIAETSHLNLVAADSVQGAITLHLNNVPWDQALDVILRAKGLDKRRNGNVIWVEPQKELASYEQRVADARIKAADSAPLMAAYIPISYGKAKEIATLLSTGAKRGGGGGGGSNNGQRGFLSPRGSVSYDERTNTLLINDTAEKVKEIKNLVARLDRPVQQVLIEARIVAATDTFARDLGVKWGVQAWQTSNNGTRFGTGGDSNGAIDAAGGSLTLGGSGSGSGGGGSSGNNNNSGGYNVSLPITNSAGSAAIAILGANYLVDLELQAAQTEGRTEIISSPRVITANQQEADIKQGQQIGYVTYQQGSAGNGLGTATVQFKDAVLELQVTPTITADKRVFLKINVHKDALDHFVDNPGGGQVPLLNTRSINTSVLVDNGQTVVFGGIYEVNKKNNVSKVPGLGDIPILGALFRQTTKSNDKAELLIFVTPRILTETGT